MSDLIDREAAVQVIADQSYCIRQRDYERIVKNIEALPAAMPLVDVEKAAREYKRTYMRLATEETANEIHERALEAAILSAGYVGAVDAGDLRRAALYLEAENTPESRELAKRLLAAIEGK